MFVRMSGRRYTACALLCLLAGLSASVTAQRLRPGGLDEQIVERAVLVAASDRIELYQHGVRADAAFLKLAEQACADIESLIGRKLDTATLGERARIYVSNTVAVSHVWRGYNHPRDPRGIVFLNFWAYQAALNGANATYAHELAHLYTWRYRSHTLREGFADYLALKIHPGAAVGPNDAGYDTRGSIDSQIVDYLGTTRAPPEWVTSDALLRRTYYASSFRFTKFLIERGGIDTFMKLYDSDDPENAFVSLYGASREALIRDATMH